MFGYEPKITHFIMPMFIFAVAEWTNDFEAWKTFSIVMYGLGAFASFVILYAFVSEIHYRNAIEPSTPRDDDDDTDAMKQETGSVHVTISDGRGNMKLFDLPATPRQLEQLATGLLIANDSFSQRKWSGSKRPFSRTQFENLVNTMIERGIAYQVNPDEPRQGYALNNIGRHVLAKYLPSPIAKEFNPETDPVSHARTDARTDALTTTQTG